MADALRAARVMPGFLDAARLHLVETSPVLRRAQEKLLRGHDLTWHETIATLPRGPALVIANEFFDALPIRQLVRTAEGWREKLVGLSAESDDLAFALSPAGTPAAVLIPQALRDAPAGSLCEIGTAAHAVADALAARHVAEGGATLVIDYGYFPRALGDTLQALRRHRRHDPLEEPGGADLTAHVDFEGIAEAAGQAGARVSGPVPQGVFLQRLGIEARAERLLAGAGPGQAADIGLAVRRLIDPGEMGTLFKVLCIAAPGMPPPAGF
jgi:NADH dehydrogenase [ubiquinone] 1 alpha subcomplex assembly factor 7